MRQSVLVQAKLGFPGYGSQKVNISTLEITGQFAI